MFWENIHMTINLEGFANYIASWFWNDQCLIGSFQRLCLCLSWDALKDILRHSSWPSKVPVKTREGSAGERKEDSRLLMAILEMRTVNHLPLQCCWDPLKQFLVLWWPPSLTITLFSLWLHNCNCAPVVNRHVNIQWAGSIICDPQVENHCANL